MNKVITFEFDGYNFYSQEKNHKKFNQNQISSIKITMGQNKIPFGTILNNLFFHSRGHSYKTESELSNIMGPSNVYLEKITSKSIDCNHLSIYSPYKDCISVANEISIFFLLRKEILTLHASSCIKNDNCVIFLGRSNSGKSSSANIISERNSSYIVGDDHVHLMFQGSNLFVSTPIWDEINKFEQIDAWLPINDLMLVCLDKIKINSLLDLRRFCVGYSYHSQINDQVHRFIDRIYHRKNGKTLTLNSDYNSIIHVGSKINFFENYG